MATVHSIEFRIGGDRLVIHGMNLDDIPETVDRLIKSWLDARGAAPSAILGALGEISSRQEFLISRMEALLMASGETIAILDQINEFTNSLAANLARVATAQSEQATKLTEIATDIDDLIAATSDADLRARLEAHRTALQAAAGIATDAADTAEQTSTTLTALAAKHDTPIPTTPSDGATT